ncbi:MAG: energy transducer TonB, partial [Oxalobacteraceae bacterium]
MAVVVSAPPVTGQKIEIVTFVPSQITCAETPMPGTGVVMSLPVIVNRYGPAVQSVPALAFRYDFVIDADGRTRTIKRNAAASTPGYYVNTSDIAPSLAASRFPAGDPQSKCSITYTGSKVPIDGAPLKVLYELASRPETEGAVGTVYDRLRPVGSDCIRGPGQYRRLNLPAFEKIARPPGAASWVFLAYDVDRAGKPNNVRVLGSS